MNPTPERTEKNTPNVTLHWDGESGDGKRAFVLAKENDGWSDLRIEVDTDDCDGDHAKAAMQVVIDRCNDYTALQSQNEALRGALEEIVERTRMVMDQTNGHWDANKQSHLRLIRVMEGNILIANKATFTPPAKA